MTDKELRKCKRTELIEMLYYLRRENDELREKADKLEAQLDVLIRRTASVSGKTDEEPATDG